jgi:hypothetical protein
MRSLHIIATGRSTRPFSVHITKQMNLSSATEEPLTIGAFNRGRIGERADDDRDNGDDDDGNDGDQDDDDEGGADDDPEVNYCDPPNGFLRIRPSKFNFIPGTVFVEYPPELGENSHS